MSRVRTCRGLPSLERRLLFSARLPLAFALWLVSVQLDAQQPRLKAAQNGADVTDRGKPEVPAANGIDDVVQPAPRPVAGDQPARRGRPGSRPRRRPDQFVPPNQQPDSESLLEQLPVELLFVKKVCAPPKERMQSIATDLAKCLRDAADGKIPTSCDLLPDRLADCVASHLSKAEATRYRSEVAKRRVHERDACVCLLVAILDQQMAFSEPQRKALIARLTAEWKPAWSQMIEMAVRDGQNSVPAALGGLIVPLLGPDQAKVWEQWPKRDAATQFNAMRIGSVGTPAARADDE